MELNNRPQPGPGGGRENLAFLFQEPFTAITRLRSNRQAVGDADAFRAHMCQLLNNAEETARARGYTAEDVRLAKFAVVAFLDESVLRLQNPVFRDWPRKPLQEELFGGHVAGEVFFQSLQRVLGRDESAETADVLEVFYLSLLLGYRGRYGVGGQAELRSLMQRVDEKIQRIRKPSTSLSPSWAPREAMGTASRDPWLKRLVFIAAGCLLAAILMFGGYRIALGTGVSALESAVAESRR
ncbi:MAG: DotU family type IV/VI secretion system protein [Bryobacterales bacterium]|nr:DotU family type IV/VI secretion system protein [Bryobacterales bacterium]